MTKDVFRFSLVKQKMRGSGCDTGRCLFMHLQADFAPVSENEFRKSRAIYFTQRYKISRETYSKQKPVQTGNPILWQYNRKWLARF